MKPPENHSLFPDLEEPAKQAGVDAPSPPPFAPAVASSHRARLTAGVDEAGRGPLAGPLVVAAVILDPKRRIDGIGDSKQLTEAQREDLYPRIVQRAIAWSIVVIEIDEIDRINIFQATMAGMTRSLRALSVAPELALIDGNRLPKDVPCAARAVVGGDAKRRAIGAASILAKVTRDRIMHALDPLHPHYGFARHKGYATPEHLDALRRHGPCPAHRRSFAPVRNAEMLDLF
jgi:ribonuclease HII